MVKPQTEAVYRMIADIWNETPDPNAQIVAERACVSTHQVYKALTHFGMSPGKGGKPKVPYERIAEVYQETQSQIRTAEILGIDKKTVYNALDSLGFESRRSGYQIKDPVPLDVARSRYEAGESVAKIAADYGVKEQTLRVRLKKIGVDMSKPNHARGRDSVLWNNGQGLSRPVAVRKQARSLGEFCLKRQLTTEEVIHHHDGDPCNNSLENLWYFPNSQTHSKYHYKLKHLRHANIQVDPSLLAKECGGIPLLRIFAQNEELPDIDQPVPSDTQR